MFVPDGGYVSGHSLFQRVGSLADILSTAAFALDQVYHSCCVAVGIALCLVGSSGYSASHRARA